MPEKPDGADHSDEGESGDSAQPERSEGIPGSRADERDFRDVDPRTLDSQRADHAKLDLDEWFERAFPNAGDFAKWIEESDFGRDPTFIHWARRDPRGLWERLGPDGQATLQGSYAASVFGATDERRPDRDGSDFAPISDAQLAELLTQDESVPKTTDGIGPDAETKKADGGWSNTSSGPEVTLPDGSKVTIETDLPPGNPDRPPTRQRTIDSDGNAGEWQPIEVVPDPPSPPAAEEVPSTTPATKVSSSGIGGPPRGLVLGGAGIFAVAMVGLVFLLSGGGGDGDSGPWFVTDPQNDFVPAFADKDAIENPSAAGDVTGLDVAIADGNTTVTVTFAGAAEGLMTEGGEELAAALQFIPIGDERWIDILFDEDGSVKISDPPSGSRITATWSASNVLVFEILGVTPASGATVRFATIQRQGFGHSSDEVSLSTGGAGAAVATAFVTDDSGGSGGGVPDAPVIVAACDVIDVEVMSAAFGSAELIRASGDAKNSRCAYETASGIELDLSVLRRSNPRSDAFGAFHSGREDAGEFRSIDWGVEGELWVFEDEESSAVGLLAYVHASDPLGREIYLRIDGRAAPGQSAMLAVAIEGFGQVLGDAVLEAQP